MRRKHSLLLIEVLIALFILAVLSAFLFMGFHYVSVCDAVNASACKEEQAVSEAYQTLTRVFSQIVEPSSEKSPKQTNYFYFASDIYRDHPSLVFTYDNEVDREPAYSKEVVARIYLDKQNRLCLVVWSLTKRDSNPDPRKRVLLENVTGLSFKFYQSPPEKQMTVSSSKVQEGQNVQEPPPGEQTQWLREYQRLPRTVKIIITQQTPEQKKGQTVLFSFLLPSPKKSIAIKNEKGE